MREPATWGRSDQHATSGSSDTPRDRPFTLVHSITHEAKYLKGASITRDDVSKFIVFLERYDANGEYVQGGVTKFIDSAATKTITRSVKSCCGCLTGFLMTLGVICGRSRTSSKA